MIQNNNLSPLPWYSDIKYQNARKSYAYGNIYPLFSQSGFILPFQFVVDYNAAPNITGAILYDKDGKTVMDLLTAMTSIGLRVLSFPTNGYNIVFYPGQLPLGITMQQGIYYLRLTVNGRYYYSEMFTVVAGGMDGYLRVQWWDDENLYYEGGHVQYSDQYKNVVYLCAELGKPEYQFEEDGENRDGFFFPEKQLSEKTYKFVFLAPEFLCDAMRIIRLSDHAVVTSNGISYNCDTFLITPKWQTQGDLASVEAEFDTNTVIKKIGRGYVPGNRGDFNNDFNDDFNNL